MSTSALSAAAPRAARGLPAFTRYAWGVLAWNLVVVLWGAFVRASDSGDGCGSHWPLCNGQVIPRDPRVATIIEFTHRITTGVAFFAVVGLLAWSFYLFPRAHLVRKTVLAAFAFLLSEAALGAGLVLFRYVAADASAGRVFYLSLHLINTHILVALLALTAWFSRDPGRVPQRPAPAFLAALAAALLVGVSGAIAALGDTLFPASSLAEGVRQDLSATGHFLLRLRVFHPLFAVLAAALFCWIALRAARAYSGKSAGNIALSILFLTFLQLCVGAVNVAMLAPVALQIIHLLIANLLWISLVLLSVEVAVV